MNDISQELIDELERIISRELISVEVKSITVKERLDHEG